MVVAGIICRAVIGPVKKNPESLVKNPHNHKIPIFLYKERKENPEIWINPDKSHPCICSCVVAVFVSNLPVPSINQISFLSRQTHITVGQNLFEKLHYSPWKKSGLNRDDPG